MLKFGVFLFLQLLGLVVSTPLNIVATLQADARFTSLVAAAIANNLTDALSGPGPLTLFAPTNAFFPNLAGVPLATQTSILTYHVLALNITSRLTGSSNTFTSLQGGKVQVTIGTGVFYSGNVYVNQFIGTEAIPCSNGVIHVLRGGILTPPSMTVTTAAIATPDLSTLVTLLGVAGYVNLFNSTGNNTVFAPTNTAFTELENSVPGITGYLLRKPAMLQRVLQYHVLNNLALTSVALYGPAGTSTTSAYAIPTLEGSDLFVTSLLGTSSNPFVEVGNPTARGLVIAEDIFVTNGIVHVIDAVLVPPTFTILPTIVEALAGDSRFSSLVAALSANGLANLFNGTNGMAYTVFAPVNSVFPNLTGTNSSQQVDVLTYHVIAYDLSGTLSTATPVSYNTLYTVQGTAVQVTVINGNVYVNERNGTEAIMCRNGVIHVLNDGALSIPMELVPTASGAGLTTLLSLVSAAGLASVVTSVNLTVFAPTNQAFADLEAAVPGVTAYLLGNVNVLSSVLAYHVLPVPTIAAAVIAESGPLNTLLGEQLPVNRTGGLTLGSNAASVVMPNVFVTNGVVHVINKVLIPASLSIPPSILEAVVADSRFTELAAALVANGLADMFNGSSAARYTVFAPVNSVFPDDLTGVNQVELLTYHVVVEDITGKLAAGNISINTFTTAQGAPVRVTLVNGAVYVNQVMGDEAIVCRNGVIHVLSNGYLSVPSDLVATATAANLTTLLSLVVAAGLDGALTSANVTVFAPTNQAFADLETAVPCITAYLSGNATALYEVLTYHVIIGEPMIAAVIIAQPGDTLLTLGGVLPFTRGAVLSLGASNAEVVAANVFVTNGVVHVIDGVLVPPTLWLPADLCAAANVTGTGTGTETGTGTGTGSGSTTSGSTTSGSTTSGTTSSNSGMNSGTNSASGSGSMSDDDSGSDMDSASMFSLFF